MPRTSEVIPPELSEHMLFSSALNVVDQGILIIDAQLKLVFANAGYIAMFALPASLVVSGTPIDVIHRYLAERGEYGTGPAESYVADRLEPLLLRKRYRLDRKRPNGIYIEVSGSPVSDGGYVFTVSDVTHRKLMQLDLEALVLERTSELQRANQELTELAALDPLLGIMNRRAFLHGAEREGRRRETTGDAISVLMLDLDHFKAINDRFGHAGGDTVLLAAVAAIRRSVRECDLFARYGGEEFVLLLPGCTVTDAEAIAERVRISIREMSLRIAGEAVRATASVGVALWRLAEPNVDLAIARADKAVYAAKRAGRDRIVSAA